VRVYAVAYRMLGNVADAEDVAQEVLLQVVRRLESFRGESTVSTWLHRVTVNAVLALRRKRKSVRECRLAGARGDREESAAHLPCPSTRPPGDAVINGELRTRVADAIAGLPVKYRDPLVLADVGHRSNAEVGELLGLSLAAVKSRLHRARLLLRDELRGYWGRPVPADPG
jgi:RNA polymerase sigma-70 factor (ECF subfamily)